MKTGMINKPALQDFREAGMERDQAEAVASHIPDWSRFATKADLENLKGELIRWMALLMAAPLLITLTGGMIALFLR